MGGGERERIINLLFFSLLSWTVVWASHNSDELSTMSGLSLFSCRHHVVVESFTAACTWPDAPLEVGSQQCCPFAQEWFVCPRKCRDVPVLNGSSRTYSPMGSWTIWRVYRWLTAYHDDPGQSYELGKRWSGRQRIKTKNMISETTVRSCHDYTETGTSSA